MWQFFIRGGPLMWPLLACSLVALTITIERIIFWWREKRRDNPELVEHIFQCTEKGNFEAAVRTDMPAPDATARVILSGLAHRQYGLTESMEVAAGDEVDRMKQGLAILDTIVTVAPLLGILGTVMGIIQSFDLLGDVMTVADPKDVIGGIAVALITTAAGLAVALPTVIAFNYFVGKVERVTRHLQQTATQFEVAYKRGLSRAAGQRI